METEKCQCEYFMSISCRYTPKTNGMGILINHCKQRPLSLSEKYGIINDMIFFLMKERENIKIKETKEENVSDFFVGVKRNDTTGYLFCEHYITQHKHKIWSAVLLFLDLYKEKIKKQIIENYPDLNNLDEYYKCKGEDVDSIDKS
ncbi:MAG: hypothetical protein Q7R52_01780 [archaeon]|nr:hypothetical protein [archaeon]